jgi:hypothetical protein
MDPLVVATGDVRADGMVKDVRGEAEKALLRREAQPHARMLVPSEWKLQDTALTPVDDLRAAVRSAYLHGDDPSEEYRRALAADQRGSWPEAARLAEALVDNAVLDEAERQQLLVILLTASNHSASEADQARWTARLDPGLLLVNGQIEPWVRAIGSRAVSAIDAFDVGKARALLAHADIVKLPDHLEVHRRGPAALLATLEGRREEALELRRDNVVVAKPRERPRCLGDLADALLRLGRPAEALDAVGLGLDEARRLGRDGEYLGRTKVYLALHRGRALLALGRVDEALGEVEAAAPFPGVDPRIRLKFLEAEARGDAGIAQRTYDALPAWAQASPIIAALLWRTRYRLGVPSAGNPRPDIAPLRGLADDEAGLRVAY